MQSVDLQADFIPIGENEPDTHGLGDGILLTAVIREVNLKYPDKKIILKTLSPKEPFLNNPRIHEIYDGYWENVELWPNGRWRGFHQIKNLCETYDVHTDNLNPEIWLSDHELSVARKTFDLLSPEKPAIMFCRNSTVPERDWRDENWHRIISMLNQRYNVFQIDETIRYDFKTGMPTRVMLTCPAARQELRGFPVRKIFALMACSKKYLGTNTGWLPAATAFSNDNYCYYGTDDGRVMDNPKVMNFHHWDFPANKNIYADESIDSVIERIRRDWMS